jgi:hypothetical protein
MSVCESDYESDGECDTTFPKLLISSLNDLSDIYYKERDHFIEMMMADSDCDDKRTMSYIKSRVKEHTLYSLRTIYYYHHMMGKGMSMQSLEEFNKEFYDDLYEELVGAESDDE